MSFTILSLRPIFKSRSACRIVQLLRNNTGQTLVHHVMWHTSNGTLFTPLLIFQEQGSMEPLNEHLTTWSTPLIEYGAPKQERTREQDLLWFTFLRHVYMDTWNSSEAPFGSSRKNHRIGRFTSPRHVYTVYTTL
jgi:hypothetical protein